MSSSHETFAGFGGGYGRISPRGQRQHRIPAIELGTRAMTDQILTSFPRIFSFNLLLPFHTHIHSFQLIYYTLILNIPTPSHWPQFSCLFCPSPRGLAVPQGQSVSINSPRNRDLSGHRDGVVWKRRSLRAPFRDIGTIRPSFRLCWPLPDRSGLCLLPRGAQIFPPRGWRVY